MNNELERLNKKYADLAGGRIYPFIRKDKITILDEGFYLKEKANYRGISFIFDKSQDKYKALLIGYFYVPKNIIIVPKNLTIKDEQRSLIIEKLEEGYEMTSGFPSLHPCEFAVGSEEYIAAENSRKQFVENDISINKS